MPAEEGARAVLARDPRERRREARGELYATKQARETRRRRAARRAGEGSEAEATAGREPRTRPRWWSATRRVVVNGVAVAVRIMDGRCRGGGGLRRRASSPAAARRRHRRWRRRRRRRHRSVASSSSTSSGRGPRAAHPTHMRAGDEPYARGLGWTERDRRDRACENRREQKVDEPARGGGAFVIVASMTQARHVLGTVLLQPPRAAGGVGMSSPARSRDHRHGRSRRDAARGREEETRRRGEEEKRRREDEEKWRRGEEEKR